MYRHVRSLRLLTVAAIAAVVVATIGLTPAAAAPLPVPVIGSEAVVSNVNSPKSYRFATVLPAGGKLIAVDSSPTGQETDRDILVKNAKGVIVGAYDAASALDASGNPVKSTFRIERASLVQTVSLTDATAFPVNLGLIYSPVPTGSATTAAVPTAGLKGVAAAAGSSQVSALAAAAAFVYVPANYVYNPYLGTLHDYCSYSPDEFNAPLAANANFRGPCARHDLCYAGTTSEWTCDARLEADMRTNCAYQYGYFNPLRATCYQVAHVYWLAVVAGR
jgi:hypothetical protein